MKHQDENVVDHSAVSSGKEETAIPELNGAAKSFDELIKYDALLQMKVLNSIQ